MNSLSESFFVKLMDDACLFMVQQNNRKRKGPTSSGPANSTGTGNTVGPSNSQPSTPSTHTPGEGISAAGNLQHVGGMSKGMMMYSTDATGGLASSTNQLVCAPSKFTKEIISRFLK